MKKTASKSTLLLASFLVLAFGFTSSAYAAKAFLKGEQKSGMNKICYYEAFGSTYTKNVKSHQLCPLSIDV